MVEAAQQRQFVVSSVPVVMGGEPLLEAPLRLAQPSPPRRLTWTSRRALVLIAALFTVAALRLAKPQAHAGGTRTVEPAQQAVRDQLLRRAAPGVRRSPRSPRAPAAHRTTASRYRRRTR